jgi:hypothetical protein
VLRAEVMVNSMSNQLNVGADNIISLNGLKNQSTGNFLNSASVTFSLTDVHGNAISGATNISMAYVTSSSGNYSGLLPSSVPLADGTVYLLSIKAVDSSGTGFWETSISAYYNRGHCQ